MFDSSFLMTLGFALYLVMIWQELHIPSVGCSSCMAFSFKGICKNDDRSILYFLV
jgi:hypothetical protein